MEKISAFTSLSARQARTLGAVFNRLFPGDPETPGAVEIGAVDYVDRALGGAYRDRLDTCQLGLRALDEVAVERHDRPFAECSSAEQDLLLGELERGHLSSFLTRPQVPFFELLRSHLLDVGARQTWRDPRITGVCGSHDRGVLRLGEDPATSVVNPDLLVHDTPGLYSFGGAAFPSCPGINPTLTMWALCYRAVDGLVERLTRGEDKYGSLQES